MPSLLFVTFINKIDRYVSYDVNVKPRRTKHNQSNRYYFCVHACMCVLTCSILSSLILPNSTFKSLPIFVVVDEDDDNDDDDDDDAAVIDGII
jgi:hypothetical protein